MKKKTLVFSLFLGMGMALQATAQLASPESITAYRDKYLVANIGAKLNIEKDGDGFISLLSAKGKVQVMNFLPFQDTIRLHSPKGMAVLGDTLLVNDIDRIVIFNLRTRKSLGIVDLEKNASYLNDMVYIGNSEILLTETVGNRVLKVNLRNKSVNSIQGEYPFANGLAYDQTSGTVYLCSSGPGFDGTGKLYQMPSGTDRFEIIKGSPSGIFDGIAVLNTGKLIVSDWRGIKGEKGSILSFDISSGEVTQISTSLVSPADFYLDRSNRRLIIPQLIPAKIAILSTTGLR